jgi:hypothetical protein
MNIIIGVIVGIFIVFNWSSIKTYFDDSLAKQGVEASDKSSSPKQQAENVDGGEKLTPAPASAAPTKPQDLNSATEQRLKDIVLGK